MERRKQVHLQRDSIFHGLEDTRGIFRVWDCHGILSCYFGPCGYTVVRGVPRKDDPGSYGCCVDLREADATLGGCLWRGEVPTNSDIHGQDMEEWVPGGLGAPGNGQWPGDDH